MSSLAAVVLAAGLGTRLRPLTTLRPKPLCPIDNVPLLDLALASVAAVTEDVAVNASHLAEQVVDHLADRPEVTVSLELPDPLGSAGALVRLREWISGRPVLLRNADTYLTADLADLVSGWDGERPRLLVQEVGAGEPADFGRVRYVGAALLPAAAVAALPPDAFGLHRLMWWPAWERGELDTVLTAATVVDCGTPRDYLQANLVASGGRSVVAPDAHVEGRLTRSVVWSGAHVGRDEHLVDCIRASDDITVAAGPSGQGPGASGTLS